MIRRTFRFGIRLGLLTAIAFALFKLMQGRRSAGEYGSPSADWAPAPPPPPPLDIPKPPPEPELVQPVILEEIVAKKAAGRPVPPEDMPAAPAGSAARTEQAPAPAPGVDATPEPVEPVEPVAKKKASPAKRAATKKAGAAAPAAAGPVKKVAPKKDTAKKDTAKKAAAAKKAEPTAKKAAPAKKATKKQQP